ncbi:pyrroline-5-carboxylate reductase [Mesorhizobium silamurunense]|uniref:pyrroline-5-carboxylate reductase n=1 Tax=Mesorhizobium silamurunense TaxID=499528 RepID=UPI00177DB65A|nr:pyrroline-5-carboxylate reductase [Mesorhizobium silamurunense]
MRIGFVGTGIITEAIVRGLLKAEFPVVEILVSPRSKPTATKLAALSPLVRIGEDNQDVVSGSDIVVLAVRPQIAEKVLRPLQFAPSTIVASLIAGVPIPTLLDWIGADVDISRAVPLPFVSDLNGVTAVYPGSDALTAIFAALGTVINCETIDEFDAFAVAGGLMGAYFGFSETCAQWLVSAGVPYGKARAYLAPFFHGLAGSAVRNPEKSFEDLRIGHTTVGGLNDQLFEQFRKDGGLQALTAALDAVGERLRQARREA